MLEKATRIASEAFARTINRRTFVNRAGATLFVSLASLAAGHSVSKVALAGDEGGAPLQPECVPPGPYCSINGQILDGCHGSSCFQHRYQGNVIQCRVYYIYQAGCWTTAAAGGYWTCCDCECGTPRVASCGSAQFSTNPFPRPDSPSGAPAA
jgi:hypothetical protein